MQLPELPAGYTWYGQPYCRNSYEEGVLWGISVWTPGIKWEREVLSGFGSSEEECVKAVLDKITEHKSFWSLSDNERLKKHLENAENQRRFYDFQLLDVLKILSKDRLIQS